MSQSVPGIATTPQVATTNSGKSYDLIPHLEPHFLYSKKKLNYSVKSLCPCVCRFLLLKNAAVR